MSEISCFVLQLLLMREDIEKELKDLINAFQAEETSNFGVFFVLVLGNLGLIARFLYPWL